MASPTCFVKYKFTNCTNIFDQFLRLEIVVIKSITETPTQKIELQNTTLISLTSYNDQKLIFKLSIRPSVLEVHMAVRSNVLIE